ADTGTAPIIIMREQYGYARDGRRDPFYSLITTSALPPTRSDLRLTGILFDQGGGHSVATLRDITTDQQYRVSLGSQLGRMRVSSIRLKSIVFTIDEFGANPQDSLTRVMRVDPPGLSDPGRHHPSEETMMSSGTLSSAMLIAFGAISTRPARAETVPPNDAKVRAVGVVPNRGTSTGRADLLIRVDGAITLKHFPLSKPDKIVVDISGATLGLPSGVSYDGVTRGGITSVRYSQFTKSVVRVVLTLDAVHTYKVSQEDGQVRVSVDGSGDKFAPWQAGPAVLAPRAAPRGAPAEA